MADTVKHTIGVDLGGTKIWAMIVAADGEVVGRLKIATLTDGTPLAEQIGDCIDALLEGADLSVDDIGGIGVAVPGVVDSQTGRFVTAPNLEIDDPELIERLKERYELPAFIGNDVNLGTLAEVYHGAGEDASTAVGMFVGTGIGGGVVVDGRLRAGPEDLAGEIGHMVLSIDGPECGCGNFGCFEALASRTAIERDIRGGLEAGRNSAIAEAAERGRIKSGAIARALAEGDELVTEVMTHAAHCLAQGVLTIRHLLNPDTLILGGGVAEACDDFLLPLIESEVRADKLTGSRDSMRIVVSRLGDDAVALGAADLARLQAEPGLAEAAPEAGAVEAAGPIGATYPTIDAVEFGVVTVDGETYDHDIHIRADGSVRKRKKKRLRKVHRTSHVVDAKELGSVCKGGPAALFIATGFDGKIRLADDATEFLEEAGLAAHLLPTSEAVHAYNGTDGPKALLLHVTC